MNKVIEHLSKKGRGGDKTIGHLTPKEIVLPKSAQTPDLLAHVKQTLGPRFGRYQVGGKDDSVNPKTGAKEFDDDRDNFGSDGDRGDGNYGGVDTGGQQGGGAGYGNFNPSDPFNANNYVGGFEPGAGQTPGTGMSGIDNYNFNTSGWDPSEVASFEAQNAATQQSGRDYATQQANYQNAQRNIIEKLMGINYQPVDDVPGVVGQNYRFDPVGFAASMVGGPLAGLAVKGARNFVDGWEEPGTLNFRLDGMNPTDPSMPGNVTGSPEEHGSSNLDAIRNFLNGGQATPFDPVAATRALTNAMNGVSSAAQTRHVTGKGYEQPAIDKIQGIFDTFGDGSNYDSLLNSDLGSSFANSAFDTKQNDLRSQYTGDVNKAFPEGGGLFSPEEFSSHVDDFLNNKFNESSAQIGRFASRGNLSGAGVGIAQTNLSNQRDAARTKIDAAAHSVADADAPKFSAIRDKALTGASNYDISGPDFSLDPYTTERDDTAKQESGSFNDDIGSLLGSQSLFNVGSSLNTAGAQQGQVSGGGSNNGVLDQLANRNLNKNRSRGVGTTGSGVF